MTKFCIADETMRQSLIEMTKINFNETNRTVDFFFDNKVKMENCVVCMEGDKPVSQLHMLPTSIRSGSELMPAHYIYAASTLPEYRGKGCMSGLLDYACEIANSRGQKFSILTPANKDLFKFYKKAGYLKFYKYKRVELTLDELKKAIGEKFFYEESSKSEQSSDIDHSNLIQIHNEFYCADGELVWDESSLKYAFDSNSNNGEKNVINENSYAISCSYSDTSAHAVEVAYSNENMRELLKGLYDTYGERKKYILNLPVRNNFFGNKGEIIDKGMIKPICNKEKRKLTKFIMSKSQISPCISFVLE